MGNWGGAELQIVIAAAPQHPNTPTPQHPNTPTPHSGAMRIRHAGREDKIELQMTPMIDIVFQLLVFFIMTFKIVLPEGDFNIRMPSASTAAMSMPSETPTIRVRLRAGADGDLAGIVVEGSPKASFDELRAYIRRLVGDAAGPDEARDQEVELDCDYDLK